MPILDLFSYRKRVADGAVPDVYVYDRLPDELRVQIVHLWRDAIGSWEANYDAWATVHDTVAREHGVFRLSRGRWHGEQCDNFLLGGPAVDRVLDLFEASFQYIYRAKSRLAAAASPGGGARRVGGSDAAERPAGVEVREVAFDHKTGLSSLTVDVGYCGECPVQYSPVAGLKAT